MNAFEKIIIIKSSNKEEEFHSFKKPNLQETLKRIFLTIFSLVIVIAIFYLAIITSIFLLLVFLFFGIVAAVAAKFRKKRKYYKMN